MATATTSVLGAPIETFLRQGRRGRPWHRRDAGASLAELVRPEALAAVRSRAGQGDEAPTAEVLDGGGVTFFRHVERASPALEALNRAIRHEVAGAPVDLAVIENRQPSHTGAHFDDTDTFIVQVEGTKDWVVWDPAPEVGRREQVARLRAEPSAGGAPPPVDGSACIRVTCGPGDVLYVPRFWAHHGRATGRSLTFSIGIHGDEPAPPPAGPGSAPVVGARPSPRPIVAGLLRFGEPAVDLEALLVRWGEVEAHRLARATAAVAGTPSLAAAAGHAGAALDLLGDLGPAEAARRLTRGEVLATLDLLGRVVAAGQPHLAEEAAGALAAAVARPRPRRTCTDALHVVEAPADAQRAVAGAVEELAAVWPGVAVAVAELAGDVVVTDDVAVLRRAGATPRTLAVAWAPGVGCSPPGVAAALGRLHLGVLRRLAPDLDRCALPGLGDQETVATALDRLVVGASRAAAAAATGRPGLRPLDRQGAADLATTLHDDPAVPALARLAADRCLALMEAHE
jgi:hypothetical protein